MGTGVGIIVGEGSHATIAHTAFVSNRRVGVAAADGGTIDLDTSLVQDTQPTPLPDPANGSRYGFGIFVNTGASANVTGVSLLRNRIASVLVIAADSNASLTDVLIGDSLNDNGGFGRGVDVQGGARADLTRSAVARSHDVGVIVFDPGSEATLTDSVIGVTTLDQNGLFGDGIVGATGVRFAMTRSTVHHNAAIAFGVSASAAFILDCFLSQSAVGIHVQDGSVLVEGNEPSPDPLAVVVSPGTRFVGNQARVGSGNVALPSVVEK
jgi:hypothetical protein